MSIAHVQSTGTQQVNSTSTRTLAFSSNVTAGSLLVVCVVSFGTSITLTVSDSQGNTYSQAGSYVVSGSRRLSIWYAMNAAAGATTVSVAPSASAFLSFSIGEYSGVATTSALVDESNSTGTGTTSTTTSVTVSEADTLIVAVVDTAGNGTVKTKDAAYAERYNQVQSATLMGILTEDHLGVSASEAATATHASVAWEAQGASFKPAPSGPNISTVGPGKDYETLQEWWDDIRTESNPAQWAECYSGADLGQLYVGNNTFTPSSTEYVRVYVADGHEHDGVDPTTGAYITYNAAYCVVNNGVGYGEKTDYMRIEGLGMLSANDGDHDHWAVGLYDCQNVLVDGCLMVGNGSGVNPSGDNGLVVLAVSRNTSVTVRNCIARNYVNTGMAAVPPGGHGFLASDNSSGANSVTVTYQNCTAYNCYRGFGTFLAIA